MFPKRYQSFRNGWKCISDVIFKCFESYLGLMEIHFVPWVVGLIVVVRDDRREAPRQGLGDPKSENI